MKEIQECLTECCKVINQQISANIGAAACFEDNPTNSIGSKNLAKLLHKKTQNLRDGLELLKLLLEMLVEAEAVVEPLIAGVEPVGVNGDYYQAHFALLRKLLANVAKI